MKSFALNVQGEVAGICRGSRRGCQCQSCYNLSHRGRDATIVLLEPGAHRAGPTLVCQNQVRKKEANDPVEAVVDEVVDAEEESLTPRR
jgi:hypothetical protein